MQVVGDTPSPWCHNEPPLAYSYIQKVKYITGMVLYSPTLKLFIPVGLQVHWDNGFLAYWDAKQLPNFLLAVPCVLMILHHSWEFTQVQATKIQGDSKKMSHKDFLLKSVLGVRFYFPICVLASEF